MHYKPTDSNSCLPYSSSHPSHVKDSILYSQFLRPRRLCSEDSDFSLKSEEMRDFFDKRGYWVPLLFQTGRQSALQTSQKESNHRNSIHPHISPSQPLSKIYHSKKPLNYFTMIPIVVECFRILH